MVGKSKKQTLTQWQGHRYFDRYASREPVLLSGDLSSSEIIITIPCYREERLIDLLDSLRNCAPVKARIGILLIFNSAQNDLEAKAYHRRQKEEVESYWKEKNSTNGLQLSILIAEELPVKKAGVGLARKVGMDQAARWLSGKPEDSSLICLDGDCTVSPTYLEELERFQHSDVTFCSLPFEHQKAETNQLEQGILYYELFLRYYKNALLWAGFPYAVHTIGSAMGCKLSAYLSMGGMNTRKAAEDFYFIHRLAPTGKHLLLNKTMVYPSARVSNRVPFGTGKAQNAFLEGSESVLQQYHPRIFMELKHFLSLNHRIDEEALPVSTLEALKSIGYLEEVRRISGQLKKEENIQQHLKAWFDGFRVLKFVHFLRNTFYPNIAVQECCTWLLKEFGAPIDNSSDLPTLLAALRKLDLNH